MSPGKADRIILLQAATAEQAAKKKPGWVQMREKHPAGAKALVDSIAFAARLKSCPVTKRSRINIEGSFSAARLAVMAALLAVLPAAAQYVGKVTTGEKETPELRSVAVLEWTGDEEKPQASRLVPVTVFDGGELQDGGIYLARPWPLAVVPEVEYELEQDGKPVGLFDIRNAGQQMGSWVGFGSWKPMPAAHPKLTAKELAKTRFDDDAQSGEPVLHRKHPAGPSGGSGSSSGSDSGGQAQPPTDPDRPVLHKKDSGSDTSKSGSGTSPSGASTSGASGSDSSKASTDDPDRPVLHKGKKSRPADEASVDSVAGDTDPDRPRLKRGKSSGDAIAVAPSLMGIPADLHQEVAVSDATSRPAHPWDYTWSNADDEAKMKSSLEDIARTALGLTPTPAPAKAAAARSSTRKSTRPAPPPQPVPLVGEQFRVFELAYGSGATLVLSAHTDGPLAQQKFVTLIAQPDLYGNVLVLKKNVTDGAHLDGAPRMHLIDAVDALADNRGELLFELRGATQRQFALYRVLRGQAEQLFVTGGGQFGTASSE
jgi:hypothetical protein